MDLGMDDRAQAIQVGFILLFAVILILFSVYQAVIVPNQNEGVEFNHNQQVQGDLIEVRNAILESKSTGQDRQVAVELGTQFPARLIAINPPAPSGLLETTDQRPIVIEQGGTDITEQVCPGTDVATRAVEYTPDYREYRETGTLRYHDVGDRVVFMADQQLIQGDQVQVIPLTGAYSQSGSGTVAFETKAGLLDTSQREDITLVVPTDLTESQWERALDGEVDPANVSVANGNATLTLGGEREISCGPVGVGDYPPSGQRGDTGNQINPASPGDIKLVDERRSGSVVSLDFNNTAGTNNFTQGRINFYEGQGGNQPTQATIAATAEPTSATLAVRGDFQTFNPDITLRGNGTVTTVELDFDQNPNPNDWFIITLQLETGERALYFVPAG